MTRLTTEPEERLSGLCEPHIVLPVQFFTRLQRTAAWTGEQRLMAAILEDAVAVCCRPTVPTTSKARHLLRETLRWLRSNERTWMFSFLRICEALDLDPAAIRRGVRIRRGEEAPAEHRPAAIPIPFAREVNDDTEPRRRAAAG